MPLPDHRAAGLSQRQERTRTGLVNAAFRLLDRAGMAAVTADAVANEAGVSRRTFFNYFASIEEALLSPLWDMLQGLADRFADAPMDESPTRSLVRFLPEIFPPDRFLRSTLIWRAVSGHAGLRRYELEQQERLREWSLELLRQRYHEAGEQVPDRLFLGGLTRSVLGAVETAIEVWVAQVDPALDSEESSRQLFLRYVERALADVERGFLEIPKRETI